MRIDAGLSFIWACLAVVRLRQGIALRDVLPLYLALQAGLVAVNFIKRKSPTRCASRFQEGIAWIGAAIPLFIQIQKGYAPVLEWLAIAGVAISIMAIFRLDRSFGIAPADRGLVSNGIYGFLRHPMYLGELLAIAAAALSSLSVWNMAILFVSIVTTVLRISWEEKIIGGYSAYAQQVRWRLIPGVW